jgi:FkbM family methyltransferase
VYVLPDGAPVAHLNRNETEYLYHEIFVLQAYMRHGITILNGDCVVDAGANIGLFTVFASRMARGVQILAFEPNPAAFACLRANAEAWGAAVTCIPCGLSSEERSADLTFFEGMSLLSGFYADTATERSVVHTYVMNQQQAPLDDARLSRQMEQLIDERMQAKTVRARLRPLSAVIAERGIERIDLLKVNVEKSELDVLRGLAPHDWPKIRQIVVEVDRSENLAPITALLARNGFEVLVEQDPLLRKTELCYVYAIRPGAASRLIHGPEAQAVRPPPVCDELVLSPGSLRKHLSERLPRHMVPHAFALVERLPLTPNGKIDRLALRAVNAGRAESRFERPRTATEVALAAIWSDLLQIQDVGINDDFFDLGGKSLVAVTLVARIHDTFGVDIQLRNLFDRSTVAGLAEMIDAMAWNGKSELPRAGDEREELAL